MRRPDGSDTIGRPSADPLGEAWLAGQSPIRRRARGAVYTPPSIVSAMVRWVALADPARIIDMGAGTGRFAVEAARRCPAAEVVAVELDPVATLLTRARLARHRLAQVRVVQGDYLDFDPGPCPGTTAFLGNPPYVRHHRLARPAKARAARLAATLGLSLSGLSGLHVHFLLATALRAVAGDAGCIITGAEWLQANYGAALRTLLASRLGLEVLHLLEPSLMAFPDVMTTAAIVSFRVGSPRRSVRVAFHASADTLGHSIDAVRSIPRTSLERSNWRFLLSSEKTSPPLAPVGGTGVPLGRYFRVHRGIATGANAFFVMTHAQAAERGLLPWVRPVVAAADTVLRSGGLVRAGATGTVLLSPPRDVDDERPEAAALRGYLAFGERRGLAARYLCRHRRPWWYLGPNAAPPVIATYMARRPPAFAENPDGLLVLNVLHGLYPRVPLTAVQLSRLVSQLNEVDLRPFGRVYQGGLVKFEPRELERAELPGASC